MSLSGRFAPQGRQAEAALRLWAEDVNASGGLVVHDRGGCRPVELLVYDDASRSGPATAWAERLILADRVDLLVGPYSSVLTLAVAEVAERHGKVLWNHGGSSDAIGRCGFRCVINLPSPASRYFTGLLEMVRTLLPGRRRLVLLSRPSGTFAEYVITGAAAYARQHDFEIVLHAPYPLRAAEYPALVTRVAACRPDLVLGVGRTEGNTTG